MRYDTFRHTSAPRAQRPGAAIVVAFLAAAMLSVAGCATKIPPPHSQVGSARVLIGEAEGEGALNFAPVELQSARESLNQAEAAMRAEEYGRALRLAERAAVDAELAQRKARAAKAERTAAEMGASIETLRRELERSNR